MVLAGGALYIVKRPSAVANDVVVGTVPATGTAPKMSSDRTGVVLEALKEELFQLEVEHKQGRVSHEEYEKAKAALDQTLERALRRVPSR